MILKLEHCIFKLLPLGVLDDMNFLKFETKITTVNCDCHILNCCWLNQRDLEELALFLDKVCDKENDIQKNSLFYEEDFFISMELDIRIDYPVLWNLKVKKENFILISIFITFYNGQGERNLYGISDFCSILSIKNFSAEIKKLIKTVFV